MPVKDAERYLPDCLDSILGQTFDSWELIAIDDHSEDSTPLILENYSKKDPRIKTVHNSGLGIIDALRTAYHLSVGEVITRMDADDLMTERKLESMHSLLMKYGLNHLITGFVEYFSDTEVGEGYRRYAAWLNRLSKSEDNFSEIYKECVIASPCWMISRSDFDRCGGFEPDVYPEDYDLCFRFRNAGLQIKSVNQVMHLWRDHSTRASRNDPNYLDNRFLDLKMHHFIDTDYNSERVLVLWGAGKKAKKISIHLKEKDIEFRWMCNNPNKIGKEIYDVMIESDTVIDEIEEAQIIVAVANPVEQEEIKTSLDRKENCQVYFFC